MSEFRDLVRKKQALSQEECVSLLKSEKRGVLSVLGDNDYPYGVPHNHFYNEEDGKLYFHSGMFGHKIEALKAHDKVSYTVYAGEPTEGEWYLTFRSVIVFGRVEFIEDRDTIYDISRKLSYQFIQDSDYIEKEVRNSGPRTAMFALIPEHISGKLVRER